MVAAIGWVLALVSSASAQITDFGTYPEPPLPALPAAGGTFVDPTFGTTILRVTDANTAGGESCGTAYSYWPTFNANSTRLWTLCDTSGETFLFDFDPLTMAISNQRPLFASVPPSGEGVRVEGAIWSKLDPDVILVQTAKRLWAYNVVSESYALLKDFSSLPNLFLDQMSVSADDDVFAFTKKHDTTFAVTGYLAYRRSTDELLANDTTHVDEVQIEKNGRYLMLKTGLQGAGAVENKILDLETGGIESLRDDGPDYATGHSDSGRGLVVGADNWNNQITVRWYATPHTFTPLINFGDDWSQDLHISMLADDEHWVTVATYRSNALPPATGPFQGEVFQVATDGSGRVRRLAHNRTVWSYYYESPRANISLDGRFIAFTSNWGGSSRHDLFVVAVPQAGLCGDGTVNAGEACDDGNLTDGDGCDSTCTPTGCGNRIVTSGEDCDDGNVTAGDCCSATCTFESTTTSCNDGNECTHTDRCDGAGICRGSAEPVAGCRAPGKGALTLKSGRNPSLLWQWSKAQTTMAELGDPVSGATNYTLCVYDTTATGSTLRARLRMPGGGTCRGKPCWAPKGTSKLAYKDKVGTPDGVMGALLKSGSGTAASIKVEAKGPYLILPPLPLAQQSAVTVQLRHDGGMCWETVFGTPASRNDAQQFKDKL